MVELQEVPAVASVGAGKLIRARQAKESSFYPQTLFLEDDCTIRSVLKLSTQCTAASVI
jgi:hypothetical protein